MWPACNELHGRNAGFQWGAGEQRQGQVWTGPETCSSGPRRRAAVALIGCRAEMKAQYAALTLAPALRTIGAEGPQQQSRHELMIAITAASNHKLLIVNQVFTRRVIKGQVQQSGSAGM